MGKDELIEELIELECDRHHDTHERLIRLIVDHLCDEYDILTWVKG